MKPVSYFFCLFLFLLGIAGVQAEPIKFEQGGASQSPGIVPKNKLQVEALAFSYTHLNKDAGNTYEIGETLLRYGLIDNRLEARARIFGLSFLNSDLGIDNLSFGTKFRLSNERGLLPNADIIVDFLIPLDNDIAADNFTHSYKLTADHTLSKKITFVTNLALVFAGTDGANSNFTRTQIPYTWELDYAFTDKLNLNAGMFGTWSLSGNQGNSVGIHTYATYMFQDNLAGIVSVLYGLNDNIDPISVNTGIVYRL